MAKTEKTEQLIERLASIKKQNEEEGLKEIMAILEKRKLTITTEVPIHINGKQVGVTIASL